MKYDLILSGVGGQGILSIAYLLDHAAMDSGLMFKQSEVHGMAQRGGAVLCQVRISDQPIASDILGLGQADLILSVEPLEALRYSAYLKKDGVVVTSSAPFPNIPDYPPLETVLEAIRRFPRHLIVDSERLAREAGSALSQNMVMTGAASRYLPINPQRLRERIRILFEKKGESVLKINGRAFDLGRAAETVV
ncbi:MAG: indolepyruvate oxidoreductase subunit beta [Kiritimatiellia bacterium]|nr:indolepyruvate oxidoreductase subunit beta [Kiritimatiellia bacterium]